ncbi:IS4 family transposase [Clostridium beijerinckii]|uniref:IS4 family transposase n=1 Tax=Clostridium beijerinckii TaxID=1520 RepID=UPI0022E7A630|nr:IS4 family transposase [Clostridium beijerinckii]
MMKAYDRILETFQKLDTSRIKQVGRLENKDFTRDRKMPFNDIMRYILSQKGKTTTMEINNYFKEINKREDRVNKQAFCKQRCRLNPKVFIQLNHEYVESFYKNSDYKTYNDYILTAIDGTILEIPNTKELQLEYECQSAKGENIRKSARAKVSGIYDLENNIMIDSVIDKYTTPERPLAKKNIETLFKLIGDDKKVITIFDRGYISIEMLIFLMGLPIFYIFRLQSGTYEDEKNLMNSNDEIVNIEINKSRLKKINDKDIKARAKQIGNINARMIRITLSTGEDEYLVTNIPHDEMDTSEIGLLYFRRWGIETSYDVIKNKLYIENISGKKKIIVEQDFHAQMLLFNMIEDLKNDANKELEINKNSGLKYEYKININILIGTFREYINVSSKS